MAVNTLYSHSKKSSTAPPKYPANAPKMVPTKVANRAATKPTAMDTWAPLMPLSTTSRPMRSAPNSKVSLLTVSVLVNLDARSFHSAYLGARGSIAVKSTFGPATMSINAVCEPSAFLPTKCGGALGVATSRCQSEATQPNWATSTRQMNKPVITKATIPTRSFLSRFQACAHTPGERGISTKTAVFISVSPLDRQIYRAHRSSD